MEDFHPTDKELLHCLLCFVTNRPVPCQAFINMAEVYGDQEPWEIFGNTVEKVQYYLTRLKRKAKKNDGNGLRFTRKVGRSGTWKRQNKGDKIFDSRGRLIGYKRSLRYENKQSSHHRQWLMKEYSLSEILNSNDKVQHKDFVLCQIKRKGQEVKFNHHQGQNMDDLLMEHPTTTEYADPHDEWDSEALELEEELKQSGLYDDSDQVEGISHEETVALEAALLAMDGPISCTESNDYEKSTVEESNAADIRNVEMDSNASHNTKEDMGSNAVSEPAPLKAIIHPLAIGGLDMLAPWTAVGDTPESWDFYRSSIFYMGESEEDTNHIDLDQFPGFDAEDFLKSSKVIHANAF
ncbi:hypothetical protein Pfo_011242 [Paulownia fortunei]|nr:hypothetical protein Pfo_011242 [Paulownia fortunei]